MAADFKPEFFLESFCSSQEFQTLRDRLVHSYYDKAEKDAVITGLREAVTARVGPLAAGELNDLQREAIIRLVAVASESVARPASTDDSEPPASSRHETEESIISKYPSPIAMCYERMVKSEPGTNGFFALLDTFEAFLNFLATVVLSAYWRDGTWHPEHNRLLLDKFYKTKWSMGDVIDLLRETARIYLRRPSPGSTPYPELCRYLFTRKGSPSPSLLVLEGLIDLRNESLAHGGGRHDKLYASIMPRHRERLEGELNRCQWLLKSSLWLPRKIEPGGLVTVADLLYGNWRKKDREVSLQLDPRDLDLNDGDIVPEKTLLLVDQKAGAYLPLFPLSLFQFQQTCEGVFFLQKREWASKARLVRVTYVSFDLVTTSERGNRYEARRQEAPTDSLESRVRQLEAALAEPGDGLRAVKDSFERVVDVDLPEVRAEQEYHVRTFAGRTTWIDGLAGWVQKTEAGGYFLLLGPPGQGKSALLAEFARVQSLNCPCLLHMMKAHRDPRRILQFLLLQADKLLDDILPKSLYDQDLEGLRNALSGALAQLAHQRGRALVVIDALDELQAPEALAFLPEYLPAGVCGILSCRPDNPIVDAIRARLPQLQQADLPPLSPNDLPAFLEKYLDADQVVELRNRKYDFDALFHRVKGNPLQLWQALNRILEQLQSGPIRDVALIDPREFPSDPEDLFKSIYEKIGEKERGHFRTEAGRVKARMVQLLAIAAEPLNIEDLRGLLEVGDKRLSLEEVRDLLREMSEYLLPLDERFRLFHQGFTEYVEAAVLGPEDTARAHQTFCRWLESRRQKGGGYYLRHFAWHLYGSGDYAEMGKLARGDYFDEVARTFGIVEGITVARSVARILSQAGNQYWDDLLAVAYKYCGFVEELRGDFSALAKLIESGETERLRSVILAQPEFLRGILMLAVAPLLLEARETELASSYWDAGVALVNPRLNLGLDSMEGHDAATSTLLLGLAAIVHHGHVPWTPPEAGPEPGSDEVPLSKTPFGLRLLLAIGSLRMRSYVCVVLASIFCSGILLALLPDFVRWPRSVSDAATMAFGISFVAGLLYLPVNWCARFFIRRMAVRVDNVLAQLDQGIRQTADPRERGRRLDRLIRLGARLRPVLPRARAWSAYAPAWVIEHYRHVAGDSAAVTRLVLLSSQFGSKAVDAMIDALRSTDSPGSLEAFHRELARSPYAPANRLQVIRLLAATLDRARDLHAFVEYLSFSLNFCSMAEVAPMLRAAPLSAIAMATLTSLEQKMASPQIGKMARLLAQLGRAPVLSTFAGSSIDSLILGILLPPIFVAAALIFGVVIVFFVGAMVLPVIAVVRVYDPFLLNPLIRGASLSEARQKLATGLQDPDFSRSMLWNCVRTRRFPMLRASWLVAPLVTRYLRETVFAQTVLRKEQLDEKFQSTFSTASERRILSNLFQHQLLPATLIVNFMEDRNLLDAVRGIKPPRSDGRPPEPMPESRDAEQLAAVLPMRPPAVHFLTALGVGLPAVLLWRRILFSLYPGDARSWFGPFLYGGLATIGSCCFLGLAQHGYSLANSWKKVPAFLRTPQRKALAYQIIVGLIFFVAGLWLVIPWVRGMAAKAGFRVATDSENDYFWIFLMPAWIFSFLAPSLVSRWRGANLFYPSAAKLWTQRIGALVLFVCILTAMAYYAHTEIHDSWTYSSSKIAERAKGDYDKGLYDEAIRECNQAIDFDAGNANAYFTRGRAYEYKGHLDLALSDGERAASLNLGTAQFYGTLAWWLALSNRPKEAITYARKGLAMSRKEAWIAVNLIDGYILDNQFDEAARIYSDYNDVKFTSGATFAEQVKSDFKALRDQRIDTLEMRRFESWLASRGE